MKYAIITLNGKQFRVSENDEFVVDNLSAEVGEKLTVKEVNYLSDGDNSVTGAPFVKDGVVALEVVATGRGPKLRVATYKAKSRSRKVHGHSQHTHTVKVVSISTK